MCNFQMTFMLFDWGHAFSPEGKRPGGLIQSHLAESGRLKGVYNIIKEHPLLRMLNDPIEGPRVLRGSPDDRPRRAPKDSQDSFAYLPAVRVAGDPEGTQ